MRLAVGQPARRAERPALRGNDPERARGLGAEKGDLPLAVGIGLNYGPAVLGDVGSEHSLSFTVIGDTVNVASRLQGLTRDLKTPLVVADAIVKQIGGGTPPVALLDQGERELRGRSGTTRPHLDTDTQTARRLPLKIR